jgi:hypothetical protein
MTQIAQMGPGPSDLLAPMLGGEMMDAMWMPSPGHSLTMA